MSGLKVLEIESIGPVPWCGMLLADMGADVLCVERPLPIEAANKGDGRFEIVKRGRRAITLDLKNTASVAMVLKLAAKADAILEGMRPGVMERLGLGPDICLALNARLVYARMTGWGQTGPLAAAAGHDINYIALSGALHAIGRHGEAPVPPLNLVGDYGGGGAFLAIGVLAALFAVRSGQPGQVVDAAMTDGVSNLMAMPYGRLAGGNWRDERGSNFVDGGAPWYDVYETADGKYLAVGAIEPQFYAALIGPAGLDLSALPAQHDRNGWPELRIRFAGAFKTKTRDSWVRHFDGIDACVSPVLSMQEAPLHPHNVFRETFVQRGGFAEPGVAPRFSRTPSAVSRPPGNDSELGRDALLEWGLSEADIAAAGISRPNF